MLLRLRVRLRWRIVLFTLRSEESRAAAIFGLPSRSTTRRTSRQPHPRRHRSENEPNSACAASRRERPASRTTSARADTTLPEPAPAQQPLRCEPTENSGCPSSIWSATIRRRFARRFRRKGRTLADETSPETTSPHWPTHPLPTIRRPAIRCETVSRDRATPPQQSPRKHPLRVRTARHSRTAQQSPSENDPA